MVIVRVIGGLGNQMFQYAYAKSLESRGYAVKIDITAFRTYALHGGYQLDKYLTSLDFATDDEIDSLLNKRNVLLKIGLWKKKIKEKSLLFNKKLLNPRDKHYIKGHFQCEKYFSGIESTLIKEFNFEASISKYTKEITTKILEADVSCSLHIRRGDYVSDPTASNVHGACDLEYYKNAINLINNKFKSVSYFIFSDDITWVKENLKSENFLYIDNEEQNLPHDDMFLMSQCNHNIIANSSFSWWGAWLNQNPKKIVIAPNKWFLDSKLNKESLDIVPANWSRL